MSVDGRRDSIAGPFSDVLLFEDGVQERNALRPTNLTAADGRLLRIFPSVATSTNMLGVLYYEAAQDGSHTMVEPVLRLRDESGKGARVRLAGQPTDWRRLSADFEFAAGQANAGDYISLASDGTRFVAVRDGRREGRSRIRVRVVRPR